LIVDNMGESMPILGVSITIIQDGKDLLTKQRDFEVWWLSGGEVIAGWERSSQGVTLWK